MGEGLPEDGRYQILRTCRVEKEDDSVGKRKYAYMGVWSTSGRPVRRLFPKINEIASRKIQPSTITPAATSVTSNSRIWRLLFDNKIPFEW